VTPQILETALVVGMGSIGQRHARLLAELGLTVSVVSARDQQNYTAFRTLREALRKSASDYIVVANPTANHLTTLDEIVECGHQGVVLVEKPLASKPGVCPEHDFAGLFVAYQLRFHPVIRELRSALGDETVLTANLYAGSYLPDWRPSRDYRDTESASKAAGGGVLRDLSHELDLACWLLGQPLMLTGIGGQIGNLEIDTDSAHALIMSTSRCPIVNIHITYLDHTRSRSIRVTTATQTIVANLETSTMTVNGEETQYEVNADDPYIAMHRAILDANTDDLCTPDEGILVVNAISAVERAERDQNWVSFV